jgi:hypothetical protein
MIQLDTLVLATQNVAEHILSIIDAEVLFPARYRAVAPRRGPPSRSAGESASAQRPGF